MSANRPVFGHRLPGTQYVVRPGAYAVVRNEAARILVVRTASGYFLPGGGIQDSESFDEAITREAAEETGCRLVLGNRIGEATELVYSAAENSGFEKQGVFFEACLLDVAAQTEAGNEPVWLDPATALTLLTHGSHRWAVQQVVAESNGSRQQ